MRLATRTALAYAILTASILLVFTYIIYFISEKNRQDEFFDRLDYKIIWRAEFIFDAKMSDSLMRKLHQKNQKLLNEAEISVYDSNENLVFSDVKMNFKDKKVISKIKKKQRLEWTNGNMQYLGIVYSYNNQDFYMIGRAKDVTGMEHIKIFKRNIIIAYILSVIVIFIIGFIFSNYTIRPLKYIISQIQDISEHNLNKRLELPKTKDELYDLSKSFNSTFNRLEKSFNNHRNFVSTISHEFRTPLSILITELELAKELNKTIDDYKISIDNALEDANRASELSSALLDFARASYDISQINLKTIRVDEVLADAKLNVLNKNGQYRVAIQYDNDVTSESSFFDMEGNPYLLQVAFVNLIENACKYSLDNTCNVKISNDDKTIQLHFSDNGVGIDSEDIPHIFDLFFRGKNKKIEKGNGVGLSIVQQIITIHNGTIDLKSELGKGSVFSVFLPISNKG